MFLFILRFWKCTLYCNIYFPKSSHSQILKTLSPLVPITSPTEIYNGDLYILPTDFERLFPHQFPPSETLKRLRPFARSWNMEQLFSSGSVIYGCLYCIRIDIEEFLIYRPFLPSSNGIRAVVWGVKSCSERWEWLVCLLFTIILNGAEAFFCSRTSPCCSAETWMPFNLSVIHNPSVTIPKVTVLARLNLRIIMKMCEFTQYWASGSAAVLDGSHSRCLLFQIQTDQIISIKLEISQIPTQLPGLPGTVNSS